MLLWNRLKQTNTEIWKATFDGLARKLTKTANLQPCDAMKFSHVNILDQALKLHVYATRVLRLTWHKNKPYMIFAYEKSKKASSIEPSPKYIAPNSLLNNWRSRSWQRQKNNSAIFPVHSAWPSLWKTWNNFYNIYANWLLKIFLELPICAAFFV